MSTASARFRWIATTPQKRWQELAPSRGPTSNARSMEINGKAFAIKLPGESFNTFVIAP